MGIVKRNHDFDPFPDIKKVGRQYANNQKKYEYKEVLYLDGWADASRYRPGDFDLVLLRLADGKTRAGWAVGYDWDGQKIKDDDVVLYWKRKDFDKDGIVDQKGAI